MTLLGPLFTANLGVSLTPGQPVETSALMRLIGGGTTKSSVKVTETSALAMPAVWRAVTLLSGTIASLPLHAYEQTGPSRQLSTGAGAELLAKPHPDLTPFELWEIVYAHQLMWGNAYLRLLRDGVGRVREMWPIRPDCVQVGRTSVIGRKLFYVTDDTFGTEPQVFSEDEVLHLPGFGYDGLVGCSPIRMAREGVGLALAAEEYGARLFGSGSLATGILQTEQRLTQKQADDLADRWAKKRQGLGQAHGTIVMDKGATFHQLSIPPEDAQFIESRRFQISEVARIFGIPPHMLADTDKSTSWGSGIEQQTIAFVVYTLRPWLTRVEQRISRVLSPESVYARYSVEGLLRGDSAARSSFYKAMWELGALSTNEIRAYEELAPVEGGDTRYVPLNHGVLGQPTTREVTDAAS